MYLFEGLRREARAVVDFPLETGRYRVGEVPLDPPLKRVLTVMGKVHCWC